MILVKIIKKKIRIKFKDKAALTGFGNLIIDI